MIAFDLDGVIIDSYNMMKDRLFNSFGILFEKEKHKSYSFDVPNVPVKDVVKIIDMCVINDTLYMLPIDHSIEFLKRLYSRTLKRLMFITARPEASREPTKQWLIKYLGRIPFELVFTNNGSKRKFLIEREIKYFVDDRYKNCIDDADIMNKMFMINRPWNDREIPDHINNIERIDNLNNIGYPYI